jgi:hypothetical protein
VLSNSDALWDDFDAGDYLAHNFLSLRADDREIVLGLKSFMEGQDLPLRSLKVLDIGPGTNLYPALVMAPWLQSIDFIEVAPRNRAYLENQTQQLDDNWQLFWDLLATDEPWASTDPQNVLSNHSTVVDGDIFLLPQSHWDVGLMFFVAESLSDLEEEFVSAFERFLQAVRPGGLVLAAFMEGSEGYEVGGIRYPAFGIRSEHVDRVVSGHLDSYEISRIGAEDDPLRDGYTGMLWLTGHRSDA